MRVRDMDAHGSYYGDFVVEVDWTVGRIMQALDEQGLSDKHHPDRHLRRSGKGRGK